MTDWGKLAACLACAAAVGAVVRLLGAPWWAVAGFAANAYLIFVAGERIVLGLRELAQLIRSGGR